MRNNLHVFLGATVADAAARPLHWVYDQKKLSNYIKGKKDKSPAEIEIKTGHTLSFRRTIYFSRNLKKGTKIDNSCLISQRPLTEPNGMLYESFIGKKIIKDVLKGTPVKLNDLSD